jgi:hypothetical protein
VDEVTTLSWVSHRKSGVRCSGAHRDVKSGAPNALWREQIIEIKRAEDLSINEGVDAAIALP